MKTEDTLKYNVEKYAGLRQFVEVDPNFEIPDEMSFIRSYVKSEEGMKWLGSILANCRDFESTYRILKIRFEEFPKDSETEDSRVIGILKDTWLMECL